MSGEEKNMAAVSPAASLVEREPSAKLDPDKTQDTRTGSSQVNTAKDDSLSV